MHVYLNKIKNVHYNVHIGGGRYAEHQHYEF